MQSSLLQVLLNELEPSKGTFRVNGKLAYASQEAWIFEGSVKQNILFGKPFEKDWYNKVVDACALRRDLQLFPYGDETLVGDKGTCLSGGQKARINLARYKLLGYPKTYSLQPIVLKSNVFCML